MQNREVFEKWFYRQNGEARGPVSTAQLGNLLATGQVAARQPVWKRKGESVVFVRASSALCRRGA
jgi:hypothetical protein